MQIIKQRVGKIQKNGARIYVEDSELPFDPGEKFSVEIDAGKNTVHVVSDPEGNYTVSRRTRVDRGTSERKLKHPVIDRVGKDIRSALQGCDSLKITYYLDENGKGRVLFEGVKKTSTVLKKGPKNVSRLKSITFCAGAGISSLCNRKAGFEEVAAVEYNPKDGRNNRFADIFSRNHPETVMFNIPMEQLSADDLPDADFWLGTLDCTDFSSAKRQGNYHTMHLFVHLMRLFYQKSKDRRPKAIMVENVEGFERVAGNTLKLCLEEEGYEVKMAKINSLDFGSRTRRVRFFLVASIFKDFEFPKATGQVQSPIIDDGVITLENLEWLEKGDNPTLDYYLKRTEEIKKGNSKHNFKLATIDIAKDKWFGTIPKTYHRGRAENIVRHPSEEKFAFLYDVDHLKHIHGIDPDYYVGETKTEGIESIGQGVCAKTFSAIVSQVHQFLVKKMTPALGEQLSFA